MQQVFGISLRNIKTCLTFTVFLISLSLPVSLYASELIYTVQTGSFYTEADAQNHFDSVMQTLTAEQVDYLRIEKIGKFYAVRIGKFGDEANAEKFFRTVSPLLKNAIVRDAYLLDERIKRLHRTSQAVEVEEFEKKSFNRGVTGEQEHEVAEKVDESKQAEIPAKDHTESKRAYRQDERNFATIEDYKQAVRTKPDIAENYYNLGIAYHRAGMYQDAIDAYKQALKLKPDYTKAYYNTGIAYSGAGMYQDAIDAYKQALKLNPAYINARNNLGVVLSRSGRYEDAVDAYQQALKLEPNDAEALYNNGVVYNQMGNYRDAIKSYEKAVKIKPDFAVAYYNLGIAYMAVDDKESALEKYNILKNLDARRAQVLFDYIDR